MGVIAYQITSLTIVNSTVYADADQRKHESSASLAFVWGIHRGQVNSPHKWSVTRKMLPFYDVITRSCPQNCKSVLGGCWQAINKEGICLCVVNVVSGFLICSRDMNKFRITYKILRPPLTVFLSLSFKKKLCHLPYKELSHTQSFDTTRRLYHEAFSRKILAKRKNILKWFVAISIHEKRKYKRQSYFHHCLNTHRLAIHSAVFPYKCELNHLNILYRMTVK